jgi:HK97 family phage portal protein
VIVETYDGIKALTSRGMQYWTSGAGTSGTSQYGPQFRNYGYLYRTQTNVRMVVDFVARNAAQVGIQIFRRKSDTDRERLAAHPLGLTLTHPNPATTRFRLIEDLMIDMGVYFNGYWLKTREPEPQRVGLIRIPPEQMTVKGGLLPTEYVWTLPGGTPEPLPPEAIVHFSGYGIDRFGGISPLETLRVILEEDIAATDYRAGFWRNAARIDGVITRADKTPAAKMSDTQVASFREQWRGRYTGRDGGGTALLVPGMDFKPQTFSAKDSEFTIAGKLRREIVAAMYHVPLTTLGILEHATFSNMREQRKQLYTDCLGPWFENLSEEFERQILPEYSDITDVYAEFNINEKLKGDFEEQAGAIQAMVGRPVMTLNEGRARLNLPAIQDPSADDVAMPLNMGNPSTPPPVPAGPSPRLLADPHAPAAAQASAIEVVRTCWERQRSRLLKVAPAARARAFDTTRWNRELAEDLLPIYRELGFGGEQAHRLSLETAARINTHSRALLEAGHPVFTPPPDGILLVEAGS